MGGLAVRLFFRVHIINPQQVFSEGVDCGARRRAPHGVVVGPAAILSKCFEWRWSMEENRWFGVILTKLDDSFCM